MSQKDLYIYNSLTSSKEKFKSLRIKRNKLKTIIDKNYPNKKKKINVI